MYFRPGYHTTKSLITAWCRALLCHKLKMSASRTDHLLAYKSLTMLAINSHQHSALCGRSSSKAFQISRHRGAVYLPPFGALTNNVPHRRDYVLECCVPEVKLLLPAERGGYATPTASKDSSGRYVAQLYLQPYKLLAGRADDGLTVVPPLEETRVPRQKGKSNLCKSVIYTSLKPTSMSLNSKLTSARL